MTVGSDVLRFGYDANGSPMYLQFNNSRYFYATNLQGDVMALVHTSGTAVVEYTYDAWGNILSTTGSMASTLGQINPLRYRGYVYDPEFALYYLQSRYYNAGLGRFNAPDAFASTGQGLTGNNMFAYAKNNPVVLKDSGGESATVAGGIIGGIFGFISALVSEIEDDEDEDGEDGIRWDKVWSCTLSSAAAGAAAGFVADVSIATCGAGTAILISAAGGALFTAANSAYTQYTLTGTVDAGKVASDAVIGAVTNGLCTGTSNCLKPIAKGLRNGIEYAYSQVIIETTPGLADVGAFVLNDLIPTAITGFAGWYGGMAYDYKTK